MLSDEERRRYHRHLILPGVGEAGQEKLHAAKVLIVGAGGLGCPVLQYIAAAGVGHIAIIDPDNVDESNLQRQVLYCPGDIGMNKALVAADKLRRQNPLIEIVALPIALTVENALELISKYDFVIDGTDNFSTRYLVNDACVILGKPFISGSIHRFEGQVSVFNYGEGPTYRCLYPEPSDAPSCSVAGVLGILPGVVGCLMANEAIKLVTGAGQTLSGKLLVADLLSPQFSTFRFKTVPANKQIKSLGNYDFTCASGEDEITVAELRRKISGNENFQLIDVRSAAEHVQENIGGELIPLETLAKNFGRIKKDIPVIVHCQSGSRSRAAVKLLRENGFENARSLQGGLLSFRELI